MSSGYHTGNLLWRGRFAGSSATGVTLAVMGGTSQFVSPVFLPPYHL
jgi:hypothetical protein